MGIPTDHSDSQDPVQASPRHRPTSDLDDLFDEPNLGNFGNDKQPGQLHEGLGLVPARPLSSTAAYGLSNFSFDYPTSFPTVNQESNPSSDTISLYPQWEFATGNHLLNNFGLPPLFSNTGGTDPAGLTSLMPQIHSLSATRGSQSGDSQFGAQLMGGQSGASVRPLATHSAAMSMQTPQANEPNIIPGQGNVRMPDWISLIKPLPPEGETVIKLRRETHVALEIIIERLPERPPAGCNGIKIPATGSVKNFADTTGKSLLEFCIRLYGATTQRRYETVCSNCVKRVGRKKGTPSLIDFYAERDIVDLKDGKVRIEFSFCCYPKDHRFGDSDYLLEVVLSEDERQNHILAQYRLPFSFSVVARLPAVQRHLSTSNPSSGEGRASTPLLVESSTTSSLAEKRLPNETPSGTGAQVGDFLATIPFQRHSEAATGNNGSLLTIDEALVEGRGTRTSISLLISPLSTLPSANEPPNLDQSAGGASQPNWIDLIKPLPQAGESIITLRRETHVAFDIISEFLPSPLPVGFSGIKIPATSSVTKYADTTGQTLLDFRIHLYGATTKRPYETVCSNCEKREGKRRGAPSMIDFHAESDIIEPKGGKIRIDFTFCCYPKDRLLGDSEYLLDIALSENADQNRIVAQCRLPFSFNVVARLLTTQGKRRRAQLEQAEEGPPDPEPRSVRPRRDDANLVVQRDPPGNAQVHRPALTVDHQGPIEDVQMFEEDNSTGLPPLVTLSQLPQDGPGPESFGALKPSVKAIAPPRTDGEPIPTLTDVNPESGSTTGGARIWLKGIDFPSPFPLFARFGSTVVPTTFSASNLLACHLPPAATPGVVDVTLSKHPSPNAPEYGTSIAKFQYLGEHDLLIPILLRIQGHGYPEMSPLLQMLLSALNDPQPNRGLQGGSHGFGPRDGPIGIDTIEALSCIQTQPNFHGIESMTKNHSHRHAPTHFQRFPSIHQAARRPRDLRHQRSHCASLRRYEGQSSQRAPVARVTRNHFGQTGWNISNLQPTGYGLAISINAKVTAGLACPPGK